MGAAGIRPFTPGLALSHSYVAALSLRALAAAFLAAGLGYAEAKKK